MSQNDNPKCLPLSEWQIKIKSPDGSSRSVPALHAHWAPRTTYVYYLCMLDGCGRLKTGADLDEWHYRTTLFRNQMEFLLGLSHHEFWSCMVYQNTALSTIVSFLQRATPFYKVPVATQTNQATLQLYSQTLNLVVRVVLRILTDRESARDWISREQHSNLIYNNFLISVPMLFDLVIALGNCNPLNVQVLQNIFAAVLRIQSSYKRDIDEGIAYFESAFANIQLQVNNDGCMGAGGGTVLNGDDSEETPYDDVTLYTLDCAYTLSILLEVCPQLMDICDVNKLAQSITGFYDSTLPMLYKQIHTINPEAESLQHVNDARQQLLNAFRNIANYLIQNILQDAKSAAMIAHKLIELFTESLAAQAFVVDYQRQYPVDVDMKMLQQACEAVKDHKVTFIVNGYQKAVQNNEYGTFDNYRHYEESLSSSSNLSSDDDDDEDDDDDVDDDVDDEANCNGEAAVSLNTKATVNQPVGRNVDLEVSAVLDVLPELGTGFVRRLLARYDTSEQAIAAIFDDNLPPDLANMDRSEPYIPPDPQDRLYRETGLRHINVYDGDAYDVMTQDDPKCIIKRGKGFPQAPKTAEALLDDKQHIAALKERYQKLAIVVDDEDDDGEYNDEYDDSYDALDEGPTVRPVHKSAELKKNLANANTATISDDESTTEEEEDNANVNGEEFSASSTARDGRKIDFCENPEVVRARYAARQQAKWGQKSSESSGKAHDVVGAPKGQGQSKDTQRNRNKKESNKAQRANHNRKAGAAFKRSKGMLS